jgi:hypothetical protein
MPTKGSRRPLPMFPRFHLPFFPFFQPCPQAAHEAVASLQFHPTASVRPRKKSCLQDFEEALFGESCRFQGPSSFVTCPSFQVPAGNACRKPPVQPRPQVPPPSLLIGQEGSHADEGNPRRGGGGPLREPSSCTRSLRTNLHLVSPQNHRRRATGSSTLSISRTRNSSKRSWE